MSRAVEEWIGKTDDTPIPPRVCSVAGCGARHDSHGYCTKHAHRFRRHGDPLGGTTDRGACIEFINTVALTYSGDECLRWPFGDNGKGYGVFHVNRVAVAAHVHICEQAHGPKPTPGHEAAHSCGKGHLGCINPRHLRWATRSENHADKLLHGTVTKGTRNGAHKLTEHDVRAIRSMLGTAPQHAIAAKFGVCQMTISHIATGEQWGWLS